MKLTAFIAALLLGTTAMAQTPAPAAPAFTFALKGFVSMSAAYQTNTFAPSGGQQSLAAGNTKDLADDQTLTFDVRQSRFNFSVKGPQVLFGATPTGVFEIDFYGGQSAGAYGHVSVYPRLRVAYSELNWGAHKLQFGQQNDLTFAMAPTSLSHIGFPLGYLTGNIGWRRPGVFGFHTFSLPSDLKLEAAWEVGRSQWADTGACTIPDVDLVTAGNQAPGCTGVGAGAPATPNGFTFGEASGGPAVQGRFTVNYKTMATAWAAAHWSQADLTGVGANAGATARIATTAYAGGLRLAIPVQPVTITVQAAGFTGENTAPLLGNFLNFGVGPATDPDVASFGYWAQLGLGLTKEFSIWALYGAQESDDKDVARSFSAARAYKNATTNVQAIYRDGGYGLSAEWINFKTTYALTASTTAILTERETKADQFMLTANYFF